MVRPFTAFVGCRSMELEQTFLSNSRERTMWWAG